MTFMLLFLAQLADIKKLLIHSSKPGIIAGGFIFIWLFAVKTERRDVYYHHHATPPPSPMSNVLDE